MTDLTRKLRKLAKSKHWQTIFSASKMLGGIELFNNKTTFTNIQLSFINWLAYYNNLNFYLEDGSMPEWAYENDLYIDAFMHYKLKEEKKEKAKAKEENVKQPKDKTGKVTIPGLKIVFKSKEKVD